MAIAKREVIHDTTVATLENGLRVLIRPDHKSGVAICNVWVKVGSNLECDSTRGWAHGTEHMIFKGTEKRGEGDFALEVADIGGSTNAGTGYETTNYYITSPAEHLPQSVDILHDALFNSTFDSDSLDAERTVLVHENHMYDDRPGGFGVTWKWGMEMLFDKSPYRFPIGGQDKNLQETPREDIVKFWKTFYQPSNMTLVIVGDVDVEDTLKLVDNKFGTVEPSEFSIPEPPEIEPIHNGMRSRIEKGDLQLSYGKMIFPGLSDNDPDRAALSVALQILTDGRSSRLYQKIQEELELVSGISMLNETGPREGILLVDFETDTARMTKSIVSICELLEDLKNVPVHESELERAKIRTERSHFFGLETVQGQSSNLGWNDSMGDLDSAFNYSSKIEAVTAQDIINICRRLFRKSSLGLMLYLPENDDLQKAGLPESTRGLESLVTPYLTDLEPVDNKTQKPVQITPYKGANATDSNIPFKELTLDNGVRLFVRENSALPVMTIGWHSVGGSCLESQDKAGLTYLTQRVAVKGFGDIPSSEFHGKIESLGASLTPTVSREYSGFYLTGLTKNLPEVMKMTNQLISKPDFRQNELDKERKLALDDLRSIDDDPFQSASLILRKTMYGEHPYGRPVIGLEDSLPSITLPHLENHYRQSMTADNLYIVAAGDVCADKLVDQLSEQLANISTSKSSVIGDLTNIRRPAGTVKRFIEKDIRQSVVLLAWPGQDSPNSDRAPLSVLRSLLNGQ
ncbi:insulinase family protein, partial [bacterium]|nr:insulinase family protein [bacterium]